MYSDVKGLTGAISPLGWSSFAATVVLFYRDGGAKTPCKWCLQPVICDLAFLLKKWPNKDMTDEELERLTPWSAEAKDYCSRSHEEEYKDDIDVSNED